MLHIHKPRLYESCGLMHAPFPQLPLITLGRVPYDLLAVDPLTMVLPQWLGAVPSGCNPYLLWTGPDRALLALACLQTTRCEPRGLMDVHTHKPRLYESCDLICASSAQPLLLAIGL